MFTKITHISLFVHHQEEALNFYTNKLGFKVHTDALMDSGFRWLTLNLHDQSDVELVLMPATTPEEKALVGKQAPSVPFLCLQSNDCKKDYEVLKEQGIEFIDIPKE